MKLPYNFAQKIIAIFIKIFLQGFKNNWKRIITFISIYAMKIRCKHVITYKLFILINKITKIKEKLHNLL